MPMTLNIKGGGSIDLFLNFECQGNPAGRQLQWREKGILPFIPLLLLCIF